jgi:potassium efflux system protein
VRYEFDRLLPPAWRFATMVVVVLFLSAATLARQEAPAAIEPSAEIDVQGLGARIAALENDAQAGELPSVAREELDLLSGTRQLLDAGLASLTRAETYARERQVAPELAAQIDAYLATPTEELVTMVDSALPLDELNAQLGAARVQLESEQELRRRIDADDAARSARRTEITAERTESTSRLDSLVAEVEAGPRADDPETLARAKRWNALAEQYRHLAKLRELDEELLLADVRRSLLEKSRSFRDRRVTVASRNVQALQDAIIQRQLASARAAEREVEDQRREAATAHPLVRSILDSNGAYARRHTEILHQAARVETIDADVQTWRRRFARSRNRVERVGLTDAIGRHLHRQRQKMPDSRILRQQTAESQAVIGRLVDEVGDLDTVRDELEDVEDAVELKLTRSTEPLPTDPKELEELRLAVRGALLQQRELATALSAAINQYVDETLLEVQNQRRELHDLLDAYADFIDERVMWIRSAEPMGRADLRAAGAAVARLVDRHAWKEVVARIWQDLRTNPASYVLCALLLLLLLIIRPRLERWLQAIAKKTRRSSTDGFRLTAGALGISVLLAATGPAILASAAWRLNTASVGHEFGAALGAGLLHAATLLLLLELIRVLCRPSGLGDAHFRWDQASLGIVRQHLRWLTPIVVPLTFVVDVVAADEDHGAALLRFAFIGTMVAYAYFLTQLLRPTAPIVRSLLVDRQGGWLDRLKYVWFALIVLVPIGAAVAAALGYVYSAVQLSERAAETVWLLLLIYVSRSLLLRCLFLAQRRLDIEQHRKKLAVESAAETERTAAIPLPSEAGADDHEAGHEQPQSVPESEEIDVAALSAQTRHLLSTAVIFSVLIALAVVWVDMVPALGFVQQVELWRPAGAPSEVATTGTVLTDPITGSGETAPAGATSQAITLGDLLFGFLILLITAMVSRNLPGLLEIVLLQRLPISPGGRYAVTTIAQYVLVIVGVVLAFGAVGIGWSKVQWLAAAITVGLGFGLQEIFANFVSGLIILFERPVRVGDTVTVGSVTGRVARLRIRATTIVDWDRKELIIPNKEFVTGQVINWTLTEQTLRIVIPVGIAYGSDTTLAEETLLGVAHDDPEVLDDPAPSVVFNAFGDSALTFNLRVFIAHIDHLIVVRHRLHRAIDTAFREVGIVIAFPQRDVHVHQAPAKDDDDGAD